MSDPRLSRDQPEEPPAGTETPPARTSRRKEIRDLRDQMARNIREAVQLRFGPNATEILQRGGTVPLNSGEADTAADAALAAIKDAGYRLVRDDDPPPADEPGGLNTWEF